MKFTVLLLCSLAAVAIALPQDQSWRSQDQNTGGGMNYGFPFGGGGWPTGFGAGATGGLPGKSTDSKLFGRFNLDDMSNVQGQQVSIGTSCTFSQDGKQKCTHHEQHRKN